MTITASELRKNIYRLLDGVLETGVPLTIRRGQQLVEIRSVDRKNKLQQLPRRELFDCDPDALISHASIEKK
ncbi:MAG: type II toxin-antitoxin system Phd/YefM family antitoxin [Polyangiaceae bacterium]|nr:type II toxin-antitoxin system Phd/YefM family antitoxin [Polyangiaceae bacterium]